MSDAPSFRQLAGRGVVGLLSESCKVLYTNVFSQRHLGRVSDLIAAKLRGTEESAAPDELKLRALLLFAAFEAWRARAEGEPISLEVGYDETHVAVGVVFKAAARESVDGLLDDLKSKSSAVVVRTNRDAGTIEVVSVLKRGVPAASGAVLEAEVTGEAPEPPKAEEVTELGDLDYSHLLEAEGPSAQERPPSPAGEIIAHGFREREEARKVEGQSEIDNTERTVEGDEREKLTAIKIEGSPEKEELDAIRIAAGPKEETDQDAIRIAADPKPKKKKGFLSKMLSFTGEDEEEAKEEAPAVNEPVSEVPVPEAVASAPAAEVEADAGTSQLLTEFQQEIGGIDRTLNKAQADVAQLKRDDRIKRWADGLMGELISERARLAELSKRLSQSVRQKENEFRNKERTLQMEIRAREEAYKAEHLRLNRTRDQLTQANMTIERLKGGTIAGADDGHYKQKYAHVQKLLVNTKDENVIIKTQLEDAKGELNSLRQTVKRQNQMLAERPLEKKTRETMQLQTPAQSAAPGAMSAEVKKKIDQANQQASKFQKESELYRLRLEESKKEETRLKAEILRLQRQIANPGSSGGASMKPGAKPAAAAKPGTGKPPKAA